MINLHMKSLCFAHGICFRLSEQDFDYFLCFIPFIKVIGQCCESGLNVARLSVDTNYCDDINQNPFSHEGELKVRS